VTVNSASSSASVLLSRILESAWNLGGWVLAALRGLHWGTVAEIVTAVATLGVALVAFFQLRRFNNQVRADFTYKVYCDLCEWLRTHPQAQRWVEDPDKILPLDFERYDEWEIYDFLTYFETVWSLWRNDLVDKEMVYDLLSEDLIKTYEANDRQIEIMIREMQTEDEDSADVFIGVEKLYNKMKQMTERKNPR